MAMVFTLRELIYNINNYNQVCLVSRHEHIGSGMAGDNMKLQSTIECEGKPFRAELASSDEDVKAKLQENSEGDSKDGLRRCPSVVGYQRRESKKRSFRTNRENLGLTFSLELFTGANWTVNVSRGELSTGQGQTRCSLHLSALTLRERAEQKVTIFVHPPYFLSQ